MSRKKEGPEAKAWREVAEFMERKKALFLCHLAEGRIYSEAYLGFDPSILVGGTRYLLFKPDEDSFVWWDEEDEITGNAEGRILAAYPLHHMCMDAGV